MGQTTAKAAIIAALSAITGYLISQQTGTTQAIITVPMTAWLLFQFRSFEKTWKTLGNFQNPVLFAINGFSASFIYHSIKGIPLSPTTNLSLGIFLISGATSLLIHKYWTIGG